MSVDIAPVRSLKHKPWQGTVRVKPSDHKCQLVIPHLDTPEPLALAVELWRKQTVRPYITIVDTGSTLENCEEIELLRSVDCEIHYIRAHGYQHASQPVSIAQDLAMALCQQTYQFNTHSDVFPVRRDLLEWMIGECSENSPAVGYRISSRDHVRAGWVQRNWRTLLGHTATMLHMPTIKSAGISWDYQRAMLSGKMDPENAADFDTEVGFGYLLTQSGFEPKFLGCDVNGERQLDENIDHVRSHASSQLLAKRHYRDTAAPDMVDAMRSTAARLHEWNRADAGFGAVAATWSESTGAQLEALRLRTRFEEFLIQNDVTFATAELRIGGESSRYSLTTQETECEKLP